MKKMTQVLAVVLCAPILTSCVTLGDMFSKNEVRFVKIRNYSSGAVRVRIVPKDLDRKTDTPDTAMKPRIIKVPAATTSNDGVVTPGVVDTETDAKIGDFAYPKRADGYDVFYEADNGGTRRLLHSDVFPQPRIHIDISVPSEFNITAQMTNLRSHLSEFSALGAEHANYSVPVLLSDMSRIEGLKAEDCATEEAVKKANSLFSRAFTGAQPSSTVKQNYEKKFNLNSNVFTQAELKIPLYADIDAKLQDDKVYQVTIMKRKTLYSVGAPSDKVLQALLEREKGGIEESGGRFAEAKCFRLLQSFHVVDASAEVTEGITNSSNLGANFASVVSLKGVFSFAEEKSERTALKGMVVDRNYRLYKRSTLVKD